jgi:ribosomal protein L12E/L44/L45/RPP1/RPP2
MADPNIDINLRRMKVQDLRRRGLDGINDPTDPAAAVPAAAAPPQPPVAAAPAQEQSPPAEEEEEEAFAVGDEEEARVELANDFDFFM